VTPTANGLVVQADTEQVFRAAVAAGLVLTHLSAGDTDGLEQVYLALTSGDARGDAA
jgi:hypothetical protein